MILDQLIGFFSSDMGIDLGTANTLVLVKDKGIIINEPSVVAVQREKYGKQKILAVGHEAKEMVGKTPGDIEAIRPMRDGVIADFDMTEKMIRYFIEKTHRRKSFLRPRIIISVPYGLTQVERKAVRESALSAGAREVFLIEEPMAAAIGANLPVREPQGNLVVDIGGGTTEVAVISLNGIVYSSSVRIGGDRFDEAIVTYVRKNFGSIIGEPTAERIKQEIGTAYIQDGDEIKEMEVHGSNIAEGAPRSFTLTSKDVLEAIQQPLSGIVAAVRTALEECQPEHAADIFERGMVLTGGGALLRNIDVLLSKESGVPTIVADEPLTCVARGGGEALDMIDMHGGDIFSEEI